MGEAIVPATGTAHELGTARRGGPAGWKGSAASTAGSLEERGNAAEVLRLVREWLAEDSGYEDEVWPALRKALNENRRAVGARLLFPE